MQESVSFDRALGNMLREKRLEQKWEAAQAALIYGEAVRGDPITRKAYLRMEEGYLPKSPRRRLILAAMLGLSPLVFGISGSNVARTIELLSPVDSSKRAKSLNLREYRSSLLSYWKQGYRDDPEAALKNIGQRIQNLHNNVLYTSSGEKDSMKQLLCAFHIRYGHIAREQGFEKSALDHFKKAVILAHEEGYTELEASALHSYGAYLFDRGEFKASLKPLKSAIDLKPAPFVTGCTLALSGFAQACIACSDDEVATAMRTIDAAEKTIGYEPDNDINQVVLTPEGFLLFKARTLMASSQKKLRSPDTAEDLVNEMTRQMRTDAKRHVAYRKLESNIVLSQVWLDRDYYPIATTLAQEALKIGEELESDIHVQFVDSIYGNLKLSSYGRDMEVAKLGIQLAKSKYAHILND